MQNKFKVVVLSEGSSCVGGKEAMKNMLEFCHENGIHVILAETRGLFARVFCDFGKGFTVVDTTGENSASAMMACVTKEITVTCLDETRPGLQSGDYVKFNEIQGMEELNNLDEPVQIEVTGPYTFKIRHSTVGNTRNGRSGYMHKK